MTKKEYEAALVKVIEYANEQSSDTTSPKEVGCRVKLTDWGIKMNDGRGAKQVGTVLDYLPWMDFPNDGTVTVKWDGKNKPESMHISHVQAIKL